MEQNIEKIKSTPVFFIIGRPRSGTTLLRFFLDAHPNVLIPTECSFILQLLNKYQNTKSWNDNIIQYFIADFKKTRFFNINNFNTGYILDELVKRKEILNFQTVCKIAISSYRSIFPKKEILILGDKNPLYSMFFENIFPIFSDAKYIHLVRDPRDNHISLMNANMAIPSISFTTHKWRHSFKIIEKFKVKYPNQFYTIRYEDLITDTEMYLKKMCEFLSVPYDPIMLNYLEYKDKFSKVYPQTILDKSHKSIVQSIDKSKAGLWKTRMTKKEAMISEWISGKSLEKSGYERKYNFINFSAFLSAIPGSVLFYMQRAVAKPVVKFPYHMQLKFIKTVRSFKFLLHKKVV